MFPPILCSKCYCVYKGYKQILFMRDDLTVLRIFGKNVPRRDAFCRCAAKCYVLSLSRRSFLVVKILVDRRELIMFLPLLIVRSMVRDVGWKGAKELWDYGHLFFIQKLL